MSILTGMGLPSIWLRVSSNFILTALSRPSGVEPSRYMPLPPFPYLLIISRLTVFLMPSASSLILYTVTFDIYKDSLGFSTD